MSDYTLAIVVDGPGTDPNHRSHWAFVTQKVGAQVGLLQQVLVIDLPRLIYQYDERKDVDVHSKGCEGSFEVASLSRQEAEKAAEVLRKESAPADGIERCQDWVLRAVISLEADELVEPGTSAEIAGLVGLPAAAVVRALGRRWTSGPASE